MWLGIIASALAVTAALGQQGPTPRPPAPPAPAPSPKPIARAQFIASMDAEFRKMDADKNGQVTRAEIEQFERVKAEASAQARSRAQFLELDTNKNGQLSPTEFAKLAPPAVIANVGPVLARMDGNLDQQLSLVEYRVATVANFDRLDVDKDGVVTPAEMKAGGITLR